MNWKHLRPLLILEIICLMVFCGCGKEKPVPEPAPVTPSASPEHVRNEVTKAETKPLSSLQVSLPDWFRDDYRDELVSIIREVLPHLDVVEKTSSPEQNWDLGLFSGISEASTTPVWLEDRFQLFANRVLLAQIGIPSVAPVWGDILQAANIAHATGNIPIPIAFPSNPEGFTWTLTALARLMGATAATPIDSTPLVNALEKIQTLYEAGLYSPDLKGSSWKQAVETFFNGQALFLLSWQYDHTVLESMVKSNIGSWISIYPVPDLSDTPGQMVLQPVRKWSWRLSEKLKEDQQAKTLLQRLQEWKPVSLPILPESQIQGWNPVDASELFSFPPTSQTGYREILRLVKTGWDGKLPSDQILKSIRIRLDSLATN